MREAQKREDILMGATGVERAVPVCGDGDGFEVGCNGGMWVPGVEEDVRLREAFEVGWGVGGHCDGEGCGVQTGCGECGGRHCLGIGYGEISGNAQGGIMKGESEGGRDIYFAGRDRQRGEL